MSEEFKSLLKAHSHSTEKALDVLRADTTDIIHQTKDMSERIASVEATISQFQINIQRFYEKDMGPLINAVAANQKAIARIEIELAQLKTKIAIWGSIGIVLGSGVVNLLIRLIGV